VSKSGGTVMAGLPGATAKPTGEPHLPARVETDAPAAGDRGDKRPGDWQCPKCGLNCFARRDTCFKCGTRKDGTPGDGRGDKKETRDGDGDQPEPERFSEDFWEEPRVSTGLKLIGEECNEGHKWRYLLKDENRRCYAAFHPSPFTEDHLKTYFERVRDGTDWKQPEGPMGLIPRKTAWMVSEGCTCTYRYGRIEVEPQVYPPWMVDLMKEVMPYCGIKFMDDWPSCCNVNLYEDGGMSVGWHADDERLFQGKFEDIRILSLSLGVKRRFELRANWPEEGEKQHRRVMLGSGDLMTMEGMVQKHFQHRVPKEDNIQGPRINLTWRWILKHAPRCPMVRRRR